MNHTEISLWTSPPFRECEFKNYRRKSAKFDENGVLAEDVVFDSAAKGTQVFITLAVVHHSDGTEEICPLVIPFYLFKGVTPVFHRGSIHLTHENRENLPKIVPEQEYLPGLEP